MVTLRLSCCCALLTSGTYRLRAAPGLGWPRMSTVSRPCWVRPMKVSRLPDGGITMARLLRATKLDVNKIMPAAGSQLTRLKYPSGATLISSLLSISLSISNSGSVFHHSVEHDGVAADGHQHQIAAIGMAAHLLDARRGPYGCGAGCRIEGALKVGNPNELNPCSQQRQASL